MIELAAKIGLGTAFYVAVLWVAQRNPRAAGMMLTFPTLNGIGLLMAEPAALEQAAHAMLLMPVLNGLFCAGYLAAFDRLVGAGHAPATASRLLVAAIAIVWLVLAWLIAGQHWGVPSARQTDYALAAAAIGLALTVALRPRRALPLTPVAPQPLSPLLHRNRNRIALFALSLAVVALVDRLDGPPAVLGVLASLPLVAFFGLHAIAGDTELPPAARRDVLAAMAGGVWLGPAIAIAFVAGFWRVLAELSRHAAGLAYIVPGGVALLAGWSLCLLTIWGSTALLQRLSSTRIP